MDKALTYCFYAGYYHPVQDYHGGHQGYGHGYNNHDVLGHKGHQGYKGSTGQYGAKHGGHGESNDLVNI